MERRPTSSRDSLKRIAMEGGLKPKARPLSLLQRPRYLHVFVILAVAAVAIAGASVGIGSSNGSIGIKEQEVVQPPSLNQARNFESVTVSSNRDAPTTGEPETDATLPVASEQSQQQPSDVLAAALEQPSSAGLSSEPVIAAPTTPYQTYQVQDGDTLTSIAKRFNVSLESLLWNNASLGDGDMLSIGKEITVPSADGLVYDVQVGDTLWNIARTFDIDVSAISSFRGNSVSDADHINDNAILLLPGARPLSPNKPEPASETPSSAPAPAEEHHDAPSASTFALASASEPLQPVETPKPAPAPAYVPPAPPVYDSRLAVGYTVEVSAGGCLNARTSPGGSINTCLGDGYVTTIVDGPVYVDDRWWWQIKSKSWVADAYLAYYDGPSVAPSAPAAPQTASSSGFIWPFIGGITNPFGAPQTGGTSHGGIDIARAGTHQAVVAAAEGRVTTASIGYGGGLGNHVVISHGNGLETVYAHFSTLAVSGGDYVSQGQIVGYTGCTGLCFGEHLHFEVHRDGVRVNPLSYLP